MQVQKNSIVPSAFNCGCLWEINYIFCSMKFRQVHFHKFVNKNNKNNNNLTNNRLGNMSGGRIKENDQNLKIWLFVWLTFFILSVKITFILFYSLLFYWRIVIPFSPDNELWSYPTKAVAAPEGVLSERKCEEWRSLQRALLRRFVCAYPSSSIGTWLSLKLLISHMSQLSIGSKVCWSGKNSYSTHFDFECDVYFALFSEWNEATPCTYCKACKVNGNLREYSNSSHCRFKKL